MTAHCVRNATHGGKQAVLNSHSCSQNLSQNKQKMNMKITIEDPAFDKDTLNFDDCRYNLSGQGIRSL
jgi:hypothetical protein